jgi:ferritin-like metal-binding protein YciE
MNSPRDDLLRALRDAHAMERYAERLLRNHATKSTPYPEVKARIEVRLTETLANQKSLANCLTRIEGSDAILQSITDDFVAAIETTDVAQTSDEVVNNLISLYAFNNQEIASYASLIAIADASGFFDTKLACEAIVLQQIAMADWIRDRLPAPTKMYLGRCASLGES